MMVSRIIQPNEVLDSLKNGLEVLYIVPDRRYRDQVTCKSLRNEAYNQIILNIEMALKENAIFLEIEQKTMEEPGKEV